MEDQGASQKPAEEFDETLGESRFGRELDTRAVPGGFEESWMAEFTREGCLLGIGEAARVEEGRLSADGRSWEAESDRSPLTSLPRFLEGVRRVLKVAGGVLGVVLGGS